MPTDAMARLLDVGDTIPRPKKQKLVIPYDVPRVDDRGILASAFVSIADRVPAVAVAGPASLSLEEHANSTFGNFGARVDDFYGKLTFAWSGDSQVVIANPAAAPTKTTFQRGNATPGPS